MATLHVDPIKVEDLPAEIVLREADVEECRAGGFTPSEAVTMSVRVSAQAWQTSYEGRILGWSGHLPVSVLGNAGVIWSLVTPAAADYPKVVGRFSQAHMAYFMSLYAEVFCQVDLHHKQARRWLRWLGFTEVSRAGRFATMRKVR